MMNKLLNQHHLAAGVVIVESDRLLLVRDHQGWSLPKGSVEPGELMNETAVREAREETGFTVRLEEVAFITEYRSRRYGRYLQVYYQAFITGTDHNHTDPDKDINEVSFVPVRQLKDYITFNPWIVPLEEWLREPVMKYHSFNLDREGSNSRSNN